MCKSVQVCIKPPWCQEMLNGPSDICSKPPMSSNGHLIIECLVTAVYSTAVLQTIIERCLILHAVSFWGHLPYLCGNVLKTTNSYALLPVSQELGRLLVSVVKGFISCRIEYL